MYLRSRLPVKKLRHLLDKRRKVRVFLWKGIWKNIISYYTSAFLINPQPRRRSLLSNKSVLLIYVLSLPVLLIHVLLLPSMFYQSSPVHVLWHACHNWFPRAMTSEKWTQKLMTCHYSDLGSASDKLKQIFHAARPIRSTTQIWVVSMEFLRSFLGRHFAGEWQSQVDVHVMTTLKCF